MTGSTHHDTVEQRLSAALDVLAETQIPETEEHPLVGTPSHSWRRWLSIAAAASIVVCGGVGIALLRSEPDPTASQAITTPVDTAAEGVSDSNQRSSRRRPTPQSKRPRRRPIDEPLDVERIAILDPAAGFGPAETLGEVDLWLGAGTGDDRHFAIRRTQTDDPVVLNWTLLADSEWSKTYSDQPDVELPDGRVAKRLIPTLVDVVNYAIQTDDGVFSASITPVAEAELAQWFSNVAGTDIDTITLPDGYQPVADEANTRLAIYDDQTTLYTTTFDDSIEFADYIETRFTGFSVEPIGDQGVFVATAPDNDVALRNDTVIWQPQPDLIVTASGPANDLTRLADALTLSDLATADLSVRGSNLDLNITDEPDLTVLGETSEGRFVYTQTTQPDGTICYSFFHDAHGGGGGCQDVPTTSTVANCGSGWSSPDEASASVFVLSDVVPDIEFSVDGRALDPNIESGTTNGVPWVFVWVREDGRASEDPSIEVAVDQSRC